jgi:hypothetical protein
VESTLYARRLPAAEALAAAERALTYTHVRTTTATPVCQAWLQVALRETPPHGGHPEGLSRASSLHNLAVFLCPGVCLWLSVPVLDCLLFALLTQAYSCEPPSMTRWLQREPIDPPKRSQLQAPAGPHISLTVPETWMNLETSCDDAMGGCAGLHESKSLLGQTKARASVTKTICISMTSSPACVGSPLGAVVRHASPPR